MGTRLKSANNASTTLSAGITAVNVSLTVADSSLFPDAPFRITIDAEIIEVGAIDKINHVFSSLTRGIENTVATEHNIGATVENRFTAGTHEELIDKFGGTIEGPLEIMGLKTRDLGKTTGAARWIKIARIQNANPIDGDEAAVIMGTFYLQNDIALAGTAQSIIHFAFGVRDGIKPMLFYYGDSRPKFRVYLHDDGWHYLYVEQPIWSRFSNIVYRHYNCVEYWTVEDPTADANLTLVWNSETDSVQNVWVGKEKIETETGAQTKVNTHANRTDNPHNVTAAQAGAVPATDVVTVAAANKLLKLNGSAKLPASITGDAATVGGKTPGNASGQIPISNGTVCTNLNAEMVGGKKLTDLVQISQQISIGVAEYHPSIVVYMGAMTVVGTDIYGFLPQAGNPAFYRVDTINKTVTNLSTISNIYGAQIPCGWWDGGNYIYYAVADNLQTGTWYIKRYSISGNSWSQIYTTTESAGLSAISIFGEGSYLYLTFNISSKLHSAKISTSGAVAYKGDALIGNVSQSLIWKSGSYLYVPAGSAVTRLIESTGKKDSTLTITLPNNYNLSGRGMTFSGKILAIASTSTSSSIVYFNGDWNPKKLILPSPIDTIDNKFAYVESTGKLWIFDGKQAISIDIPDVLN